MKSGYRILVVFFPTILIYRMIQRMMKYGLKIAEIKREISMSFVEIL